MALTCARLILNTKKDDGSTPPWSLLPDISTDDEKRRQHSLAEPADPYIYQRRRRRSAFMRPPNTENDNAGTPLRSLLPKISTNKEGGAALFAPA